jgi:hypothetical protein
VSHQDAGHYATKHPVGSVPDPKIVAALQPKASGSSITCAVAHEIARKLNIAPAQVGMTIDLLEYRIEKCQLGLFGYHPHKKIVAPAETVSQALTDALAPARKLGRLPCAETWALADTMGITKLAIAAACEAFQIKITPCQLGAFSPKKA